VGTYAESGAIGGLASLVTGGVLYGAGKVVGGLTSASGSGGGIAGREGVAFELKHIAKHLPDTPQSSRLIAREGAAHVFNDRVTFEAVENALYEGGQATGMVRGTERFGLMFENPIGFRVGADGSRLRLHYGELKLNPNNGLYHIMPRTGPSKP